MSQKPKVAFYWCASCGGCEEAVVDLAEGILDVAAAIDIVYWPVAMDFKRQDIEAMEDGSIVVTFLNGAIRTTEQEEMAHLLRRKSKYMIAFGACAQLGGIPGLANLWDRSSIFQNVYTAGQTTVNAQGTVPQQKHTDSGRTVTLPGFYDTVKTLEQTVDVDYYVPGCPPTPDLLKQAVEALLAGQLPPKGSVLAPDRALCEDCPRKDTKPERLSIETFKRPHQVLIDHDKCLLAQGLLCLGPATRTGCGVRCIQGNMPCTGCFGPTSRVKDYGGKVLSAMASLLEAKDDKDILKVIESVPDPVGTFYRYSLPASLLVRKRMEVPTDAR
jgi:F420-non-reducing hydrogenase small subunit